MAGPFFQWATARINHFSCQSEERTTSLFQGVSYSRTYRQICITRFRDFTKSRLTVPKTRKLVGMAEPRDPDPLFANPKRLLLDMAQEQSLTELLRLIASRLGESARIALIRIWL